ncbi:MCE family protein [Nocardioides albus]|uniref:Phospholipid/cholesterol/gamma-HCH transport system substrate-binding protein n=1 Tax=Nocardioides albus TaxID=1841 RepID=A0A7W5A131_9ACTN|nr:MlaD family protein [Nocardioides albus]MBB3087692.1 phospholipid/cholesterol/gamma-HCH transport system substrate-binding protein [Nocardioides albus]GGU10767.1 ABC transporter substrate-binding protein [Nocardioides albus]
MSAVKLFDAKTFQDFWKLIIFVIVTTLATALLAITIGNVTFGQTDEYKAVFTDVTGVNKGDDVRIAGVKVGSVKDIEISDDARSAVVTFSVDSAQQIATTTEATIKYRNLIGQRYLALTNQLVGDASAMQEGQTIPVGQTHPALDLTVLFNGFKPLFQALSPNDVNTLSYEIVQVFQGEGGTLESLLSHTASLTSTLAEKDQIINALIDNLTEVLEHVGDREKELSRLIVTFRDFVGGLNNDREAILGSLDQISALSVETADLVHEAKDPLLEDLREARRFSDEVAKDKKQLDDALQLQPIKLDKIGATASYGGWFNFYLCGLRGTIRDAEGKDQFIDLYKPGQARCNLG